MQTDIRTVTYHRCDLNSLISSTNSGIANGMDDNSELSENTVGCSSFIQQIDRREGPSNLLCGSFSNGRRHINEKLTCTDHLQPSRSVLLDVISRDTLSSRRLSFNASVVADALDRAFPLFPPVSSSSAIGVSANAADFLISKVGILLTILVSCKLNDLTSAVNIVLAFDALSASAILSLFGTPNTLAFWKRCCTCLRRYCNDTGDIRVRFVISAATVERRVQFLRYHQSTCIVCKAIFTFGSNSNAPQSDNTVFGLFGASTNTVLANAPSFAFKPPHRKHRFLISRNHSHSLLSFGQQVITREACRRAVVVSIGHRGPASSFSP